MKNKSYKRYLSTLLVVLTFSLVGYSSAYLIGGVGAMSKKSDVMVGIEESSFLHFSQTGHIAADITPDNLYNQGDNLVKETTATVTLKGSAQTPKYYYVTLFIGENNFVYTTDEKYPELLLNLYDKDGTEITIIEGLEYVTINGTSGFDVTITEAQKHVLFEEVKIEIPLGQTLTQDDYKIKFTMVNLDTIQDVNAAKTFDAQFVFTELENEINYIESVVLDNYNTTYDELVLQDNLDFSVNAGTTKSIHTMEDDYTSATGRESIYFRGTVDNNWVFFGGFYWRIIRIDGAGNIKLIYSGTTAPTAAQSIVKTGDDTHIGTSYYNYSITGSYTHMVGYMYSETESHGLTTDSIAKNKIDTWYEASLLDTEAEMYITDGLYCNNRAIYFDPGTAGLSSLIGTESTTIGYGVPTSTKYFGARVRAYESYNPSLNCQYKEDSYTVKDTVYGNGALTYPSALITNDELVMAGFLINAAGDYYKNGYLHTGLSYYSMSPATSTATVTYVYSISTSGGINSTAVAASSSTNFFNTTNPEKNPSTTTLRPVITIKASMPTTGDGTYNNPFTLTTN